MQCGGKIGGIVEGPVYSEPDPEGARSRLQMYVAGPVLRPLGYDHINQAYDRRLIRYSEELVWSLRFALQQFHLAQVLAHGKLLNTFGSQIMTVYGPQDICLSSYDKFDPQLGYPCQFIYGQHVQWIGDCHGKGAIFPGDRYGAVFSGNGLRNNVDNVRWDRCVFKTYEIKTELFSKGP